MSDKNKLVSDAAKEFRLQAQNAKTQAKLEAVTFRKERETQLISEARKLYNAKLERIYREKTSPTIQTAVVTPDKSSQSVSVATLANLSTEDILSDMQEDEDEEE